MVKDWLKDRKNTERVIAFSDAIFAIAITLLILNIVVPETQPAGGVAQILRDLTPHFISFGISFYVIGRFWMAHLHLFNFIKHPSHPLIIIDLGLMASVVFLPFTTDLYGSHSEDLIALTVYLVNIFITGFLLFVIWRYVMRHSDLAYKDKFNKKYFASQSIEIMIVPINFLIVLFAAYMYQPLVKHFWVVFIAITVVVVVFKRILRASRSRAK